MTGMDESEGGEQAPPGAKLAEEFKLLLGVLAERAEPWLARLANTPEGAEHSPATCGWCPLCAGLAVLRGERPELAVRAAEHASGLLAVLRASLAERPPAEATQAQAEAADEPAPEPERVQKITIRRRGSGSET
jgi:hypothetical protein